MAKFAGEDIYCIVTGAPNADEHHLCTQKARPDLKEKPWNRIPLAHALHEECHKIGLLRMAQKYPAVANWLEMHEWAFDPFLLRWHHPQAAKSPT